VQTHKSSIGRERSFFLVCTVALLVLVVGGFGANALVHPETVPPVTATVVMHGIVMLGWYLLLAGQAALVRARRLSVHRGLGRASVALAAAMVTIGPVIMISGYRHLGDALVTMSNVVNLATFAAFYVIAFVQRRNGASHKRLMLFAGIAMLPPALARLAQVFGQGVLASIPIWVLVIAVPVIHDLRSSGRLHPATAWAAVILVVEIPLIVVLGSSPAWSAWLATAFPR